MNSELFMLTTVNSLLLDISRSRNECVDYEMFDSSYIYVSYLTGFHLFLYMHVGCQTGFSTFLSMCQ